LWRTWFGLQGLCKVVWNDVVPANNKLEKDAHKIPDHLRNYQKFFEGITGKAIDEDAILLQSERVYQLERVLARKLGYGTRQFDTMPYRAKGPVTVVEYESRAERYDEQLKDKLDVDPSGKSTEEKMALLREYREKQYELVTDAAYKRRGWTSNGVPTIERLKKIGIDLPELVEVIADDQEPA
jgi:aldehyde:ferredoxin oxidoreductase